MQRIRTSTTTRGCSFASLAVASSASVTRRRPRINATVRHYIDHNATIVVLANVDEGSPRMAAGVADLIVSSLELGVRPCPPERT